MRLSSEPVSIVRVFVSSPGDVKEEREIIGRVLNKINQSDGERYGVRLEEFRWEQNVVPQIGPPAQEVIDDQTPSYGIYVGIMGAKFGTPTGSYGSGTEKEFTDAFSRWSAHGTPWITFYFRDQPIQTDNPEVADQYRQVAAFRQSVYKLGLARSYSSLKGDPGCFEELLDRDLRGVLSKAIERQRRKPWMLLTSSSIRRRQLLEQIGFHEHIDFVTEAASVKPVDSVNADDGDSGPVSVKAARVRAVETARAKIRYAIRDLRAIERHALAKDQVVVIGADTIVLCEGAVLDNPLPKPLELAGPQDLRQARVTAIDMLKKQSGKTISVITGLVLALADDLTQERSVSVVTEAKLRDLKDDDIIQYVDATCPFDKAGGLGIQDQGIALFDLLKGSYTNVVGLPLGELYTLLQDSVFNRRVRMPHALLHNRHSGASRRQADSDTDSKLSLVSVGDINYDFVYNDLPVDFFTSLEAPGAKVLGQIRRGAGGTAVNFAKGARAAGFGCCTVVGVVGGDALGTMIERELTDAGINTVLPCDYNQQTSVAIVLRNCAQHDTSLTLTDARQGLPSSVVERVKPVIEKSDVLYVSGYCFIDANRVDTARSLFKIAHQNGVVTVLDVVVGMNRSVPFDRLITLCCDEGHSNVDVMVSELPEVMGWLGIAAPQDDETAVFDALCGKGGLRRLHQHFNALLLRTSSYSHELISTRHGVVGPNALDYTSSRNRLGYGDRLTSRHIYNYLSPRVLLASQSPQRLNLMGQIIALNKVVAVPSQLTEENISGESPEDRVKRLALAKAMCVQKQGAFPKTIEVIIGADTEVDVDGEEMVYRHPQTPAEAREVLFRLSERRVSVLTGLAVLGRKVGSDASGMPLQVVECVRTRIKFRSLSKDQIEQYIATEEPFGRAGGFAIQGRGALLVDHIEGSYSNVVGLPLEKLCAILDEKFAMPIWHLNKFSNWRFASPLVKAYA